MEKTLVIIKPDAMHKKLVGTILQVYEAHGLKIADMYMTLATRDILEKHYQEHKDQPFFEPLIEFMSSQPVIIMALEGENAVEVVREINGATNPAKARPCTIRYLYGSNVQQNAVHGSATVEDAKREISIWFADSEEEQ